MNDTEFVEYLKYALENNLSGFTFSDPKNAILELADYIDLTSVIKSLSPEAIEHISLKLETNEVEDGFVVKDIVEPFVIKK